MERGFGYAVSNVNAFTGTSFGSERALGINQKAEVKPASVTAQDPKPRI